MSSSVVYCSIHTVHVLEEAPGLVSRRRELASDTWRSKPGTFCFFPWALVTLRAFENPFSLLALLWGLSATLHDLIVPWWSPDFDKTGQHLMCIDSSTTVPLRPLSVAFDYFFFQIFYTQDSLLKVRFHRLFVHKDQMLFAVIDDPTKYSPAAAAAGGKSPRRHRLPKGHQKRKRGPFLSARCARRKTLFQKS